MFTGLLPKLYSLASGGGFDWNEYFNSPVGECSIQKDIYRKFLFSLNGDVELVYGKGTVSKEVADFVIRNEGLKRITESHDYLLNNCGHTENSIKEVLGDLNPNIIESIKLYYPDKKIPVFGDTLTSYSTLAVQKVSSGLHEAYSGLLNKLGIAVHEAPNYISGKVASMTGSDDASLVLGLAIGGVIGLGAYVGRKMGKSGLLYKNE
jgi:hypothetical protein